MIARIWTTRLEIGKVELYEQFACSVSLEMFRSHPGFYGCIMGHRQDEAFVMTVWATEEHMLSFENADAYLETVKKIQSLMCLTDFKKQNGM